MWSLALCVAMVLWFGGVSALPITCSRDDQCSPGHFCDTSSKFCRECILCENLKRDPPAHLSPSACIKSVSDCGGCKKGLVVNLLGEVNSACVPAAREGADAVLPAYVWVLIGIVLLFVIIIVVVIVYVLRNKETIKMISWTTERQYSEPPPPYNPRYSAVRDSSPSPAPYTPPEPRNYYPAENNTNEDASFIKRNSFSEPRTALEKDGNQAAVMFNPPAYLNRDQTPSNEAVAVSEESDTYENPMLHDEGTIESVWTPHEPEDNSDNNNAATVAVPVAGRPAKKLCLSQDTNNNKNRDAGTCGSEKSSGGAGYSCSPSPTQSKPAFVINVVQINK